MQNHCSTEVRNSHVAKNIESSMVWWHWLLSQYFGGRGQPGLSNTPNSKCANKKKDSKSRSWASLLPCGIQDMAPLAKAWNAVCPVLYKDMCWCPSYGRTIVWSPAPPGFSDKHPMEPGQEFLLPFPMCWAATFYSLLSLPYCFPCLASNSMTSMWLGDY